MAIVSKISEADHKRSTRFAIITYACVMLSFVTIIGLAVFFSMRNEAQKTGFKAITVSQPISFFDNTYVDKNIKK